MYLLDSVAQIINDDGIATLGEDLFILDAPSAVQNYIVVLPDYKPATIDPDLPNYHTMNFKVVVRNVDHEAGMALCNLIINSTTLYSYEDLFLKIKRLQPLSLPMVFRRSDMGVIEFSITYNARFIIK